MLLRLKHRKLRMSKRDIREPKRFRFLGTNSHLEATFGLCLDLVRPGAGHDLLKDRYWEDL